MSRTDSLPEVRGVHKIIRELRYHEASRQWFAVLFILLVSLLGQPVASLLYAGTVIAIIGESVRVWATGHVKKNRELATDGPYAYVRHPLYVGNILLLAGFSLASSLWWAFPLMLLLLFFYYPPAISYEDKKLKHAFGKKWEQWSESTHALIPAFTSRSGTSSSGWSFRQFAIRNAESVIVVYLIGCLYILYSK